MDINRNNYETYFLLYIDDELSYQEKEAVENFVGIHSDLKVEFENLKSIKLPYHNPPFFDKTNLFQNSTSDDNLMLYIDNELDAQSSLSIKNSINKNPKLKVKLTEFENCKLTNEHIECPNKISLYKKYKTPIIPISFKKIVSVAAILILIVLSSKYLQQPTARNKNEIVVKNSSIKIIEKNNLSNPNTINIKNNSFKTIVKTANNLNFKKLDDSLQVKYITYENKIDDVANVAFLDTKFYQIKTELAIIDTLKTTIVVKEINNLTAIPLNNFDKTNSNNLTANDLNEKDLNEKEKNKFIYVANIKLNKTKLTNFLSKINTPEILLKAIE